MATIKKLLKSAPRMRGATPVPNGPLVKKKGEFKGSTLKEGGKVKKAQDGRKVDDFFKKLGPKSDSASSKVMTPDEIKKRTVSDKPKIQTPGVIGGFKPLSNPVKVPSSRIGGKIKKAKTGAWQRKEGKNPSGGLNAKGRASLKAEGHNIKPPQPGGGPRKRSFCARMSGMKKKLTSAKTANDPNSRINKSLRKWKC